MTNKPRIRLRNNVPYFNEFQPARPT